MISLNSLLTRCIDMPPDMAANPRGGHKQAVQLGPRNPVFHVISAHGGPVLNITLHHTHRD